MTAGAQLVELDLSDNALGPNGILGVMDLLRSPSCFTLKVLKFNNDGLGIGGGKVRHSSFVFLQSGLCISSSCVRVYRDWVRW